MLTASELAAIQAVATASLDTSCVIQRATATADGYGSTAKTWATVATVNATMAQPTAGQLQNYDYLIGNLATWLIRLPYGTDVRIDDQLILNGVTLTVQAPLTPQSYQASVRVLASEVR